MKNIGTFYTGNSAVLYFTYCYNNKISTLKLGLVYNRFNDRRISDLLDNGIRINDDPLPEEIVKGILLYYNHGNRLLDGFRYFYINNMSEKLEEMLKSSDLETFNMAIDLIL